MPRPITPDLVYHITAVASPSVAPDGTQLVFTRAKIAPETQSGHSQIMMMELPNGEATPFTQGPKDSSPKFSPDGKMIAFLRADEKSRAQLWFIPANGGEARQLTRLPSSVIEFEWSPNSRSIAFVSDVDPDRLPEDHDPKKDPRVKVIRRIRYRYDTIGWRGDAHRHIFVMGINTDEKPRQITDGDWDDLSPVWSPDGKRIAFISNRREDRDLTMFTEAYVVSTTGGEPECWSSHLSTIGNIIWSPDGSQLLVIGSEDEELGAGWQGFLYMLKPSRAPKKLTDDSFKISAGFRPILPAPELRWTDKGRILFLAEAKGESFLYEMSESGDELRSIAGGDTLFNDLTIDAKTKKAVVLSIPPVSAGELHLIDTEKGTSRLLVNENKEYFKEHPTAKLEKFSFQRAGMEIESRLLFPPDFDPSKKYPLIVDVHGGPHGVFYDTFNPTQQVLATAGYLVLCVNPRGSSTYGAEFVKAVLSDWGGEDFLDIMAALDKVCTRPYVDTDRLGVQGYSYGGFMTAWIVGHTNRFRAAIVGAPCIDLPSFYGTSDIGVSFGEIQWGGTRMEALKAFIEHSPIHFVQKVETPVLLLHGEADHRCPIEQSEQFFVALKRLGKEVEFVRFPGCSHLFLRNGHPKLREEYLMRVKMWFDKHLTPQASRNGAKRAATASSKR
ncbi:S9 family peptidase [Candidatus Acetothermia bacterium]|nr:S9 family peptidase [Candidatus Acetothermia bacterium]